MLQKHNLSLWFAFYLLYLLSVFFYKLQKSHLAFHPCRCGYEFCYNCGAEWKDKKPTCSCPLWEEDNILYDDDRDFDDDDDDEDEEDEEWYTDSDEDYLF